MIDRQRCWIVLLLSLLLVTCVSSPDDTPRHTARGERLLEQGVASFERDEYRNAITLFDQALQFYQGLDHREGIAQSRINLAESALSVGNLSAAEHYLQQLNTMLEEKGLVGYRIRITLLSSRLEFMRGQYEKAQHTISALLPSFNDKQQLTQPVDLQMLNIIASQTRLAFKLEPQQAVLWTQRFENALQQSNKPLDNFHALLLRFQSDLSHRLGNHQQARQQLEDALTIYRKNAKRPDIADTLQSLAQIYSEQGQYLQAEKLLQRSLNIRILILDRIGTQNTLHELIDISKKLQRTERINVYKQLLGKLEDQDTKQWQHLELNIKNLEL